MAEALDTRRVILRAAEELFMQYGYASVSMRRLVDEIAKQRRLTKPAIYYHFADKEALYVAVLLEVAARQGAKLRAAAVAAGALRARLITLAEVLAHVNPEALTRMRLDIEQHVGAEARAALQQAFQREIFGPVLAVFEQAAREGQLRAGVTPALAASALLGLIGGLANRERQYPGVSASALAVDLLLEGVGRA